VIVLRYYEDLSEAETADILGISVGTVKSQASRALAAMRSRVHDDPVLAQDGAPADRSVTDREEES
jgi:DNA-directed RNA polymerase specialized sigma24 family protein